MVRPSVFVTFVLFAASLVLAEGGPKKVANPLHGTWKITKWSVGGEENGGAEPIGITFRFDADGKTVEVTPREKKETGTYDADATKSPHTIVIQPPGNEPPGRGIYRIEKDTLTICVAIKKDVAAPKEFAVGKTDGLIMFTLERVK